MKHFLMRQLQYVLRVLAKMIIRKYRPSIIAITGSVGKTETKQAIEAALKESRNVRASSGNFNNEFGVPLTIIGSWKAIEGYFFWIRVIATGIRTIIYGGPYPEVLILEYGVQKPGDMDYLLSIAAPSIAVMTAIDVTPVHAEFFADAASLASEKAKLAEAVPPGGFVVCNGDSEIVAAMRGSLRGRVITFGADAKVDIRITNFNYLETEVKPIGIGWKIEYAGSMVPFRFTGILGKPHAYATAAGTAVGLVFGLNLVRIADDIQKHYVPPKHRMQIVEGKNGVTIIDDSYNASPIAMESAAEVLASLGAKRKVAVLGDRLELGSYREAAHHMIGKRISKIVDVLVTVGIAARAIAEEAHQEKRKKISVTAVLFVAEAVELVPGLLKPGDLVLVKGSRGVALDRLVDVLRA
jgi:UDP-N-acetylmuramoyl-tripeptide--D-alanyl-D-alanine ligase